MSQRAVTISKSQDVKGLIIVKGHISWTDHVPNILGNNKKKHSMKGNNLNIWNMKFNKLMYKLGKHSEKRVTIGVDPLKVQHFHWPPLHYEIKK